MFESVEEAEKAALELNKQYIGSRYVNLTKLDYKSYKIFNDGGREGKYLLSFAYNFKIIGLI